MGSNFRTKFLRWSERSKTEILSPCMERFDWNPDLPEIALIHIFRFEGDLIIEEWEAAQEVPKESPNENGMF